jgi:hypothetical protein
MNKEKDLINFALVALVLDLLTLTVLVIDLCGGGVDKRWFYGLLVMHSISERQLHSFVAKYRDEVKELKNKLYDSTTHTR